jgi:DNA-binding response OmpR family regulator
MVNLNRRVLVAGKSDLLNQALCEQLEKSEDIQEVLLFSEIKELVDEIENSNNLDPIILDEGFLDEDLEDFLEKTSKKPQVFFLTKNDYEYKLDYVEIIKKPFSLCSFIQNLSAKINLYEHSDSASFKIGDLLFLQSTKQLENQKTGEKIKLTEKEVAILRFLKRAGGEGVDRDILLNDVWGYNPSVTTHTLETHIYRLRQKIEENPSEAKFLTTDEEGGYKLLAE